MEVESKTCGYAVELETMSHIKGCSLTRHKEKTGESMMGCGSACYGGDHEKCIIKLRRAPIK